MPGFGAAGGPWAGSVGWAPRVGRLGSAGGGARQIITGGRVCLEGWGVTVYPRLRAGFQSRRGPCGRHNLSTPRAGAGWLWAGAGIDRRGSAGWDLAGRGAPSLGFRGGPGTPGCGRGRCRSSGGPAVGAAVVGTGCFRRPLGGPGAWPGVVFSPGPSAALRMSEWGQAYKDKKGNKHKKDMCLLSFWCWLAGGPGGGASQFITALTWGFGFSARFGP